jgi:hypothetical protein
MSEHWNWSKRRPRRYESIKLADGRLFVHGCPIALRSCVLEFWYRRTWRCRFAIDADGAQGLVSSWQRLVHEPCQAAAPYSSYPSYGNHIYGAHPLGRPYGSYGGYSKTPVESPEMASASSAQQRPARAYGAYSLQTSSSNLEIPTAAEKLDEPVSRAFVTLVGTNEYGTSRLLYLSKIQNVSVTLDAFELEQASVTFRFQSGRTLPEIVHINDGCKS